MPRPSPCRRAGSATTRRSCTPGDLAGLGVESGDVVEIRSDRAAILAVAEADETVRPGTVSLSHSFGDLPGPDEDVRMVGSNPGRLVADDDVYDRFSGQPRMSNVPVAIRAVRGGHRS